MCRKEREDGLSLCWAVHWAQPLAEGGRRVGWISGGLDNLGCAVYDEGALDSVRVDVIMASGFSLKFERETRNVRVEVHYLQYYVYS